MRQLGRFYTWKKSGSENLSGFHMSNMSMPKTALRFDFYMNRRVAGVENEKTLYAATSKIAFSIACILDGSRITDLNGEPFVPFVGFANKRCGDEILASEGGTWMDEYSHGTVDDVFEREGKSK